jgi:prepilin-type N-terminal cleavage/methylation domain-containing protein
VSRRQNGSHRSRDGGFSLIELLVAVSLFTAVLALVSGVVIESLKSSTDTRNRLANLDQVRAGMDSMTKSLRTSVRPEQLNGHCVASCDVAFESAKDYQVTFYANLGEVDAAGRAAPTRFSYTVGPDPRDATGKTAVVTEMRQQVLPTWASGDYAFAGPCTVNTAVAGCSAREITRGLRWPFPDGPAFVYYDGAHAVLPEAELLTAAQRGVISAVDITLPVGNADHPSPSVTSSVFLPNSILGR